MHCVFVRFQVREYSARTAPCQTICNCARAAECTVRSVRCVDRSWVCMSFQLFALARVSYPGGRGISRYIGATIT